MDFFNNISIKIRLALFMTFMALMILGGGGIVMSNRALEATYKDRLEPTKMIGRIMLLMNENRVQVMLALQHNPQSPSFKKHDHALSTTATELRELVERFKVTE